ncbi:response regulator transcription factor [Peribacillus sp. SCS-26]|uniref:response regulator transcription factor n=1 Tax=Paraperibacillus marinus TaxID=3115295 RepID=UPI003905C1E2
MGTKVLVVDDEKNIREVISSYLKKAGYEALEAASGREALSQAAVHSPDFMVLDLMLPDITGEAVCREIRRFSAMPIIMLTAKAAENDKLQGLAIGADDYMVKPFSPRELVMRIKTIMRRTKNDALLAEYVSFNKGDLTIDRSRQEVCVRGESISLTPSEYKLLLVLAKYPQRIYTREQLVDMVLGYDFEGEPRIIDQHIKNLRHKMEANPKKPVYLVTAFGAGYKFTGERS